MSTVDVQGAQTRHLRSWYLEGGTEFLRRESAVGVQKEALTRGSRRALQVLKH